jgi:hypothetical protein
MTRPITIGPRAKPALDRLIGAPLNLVRRQRIAAVPKKGHDGAARQHGIDDREMNRRAAVFARSYRK